MWRRRALNALLSVALSFFSFQSTVQAAIVPTTALAGEPAADLPGTDPAALARRLEALGLDPTMAQQRVAALDENERRELARRLAQLPAGGDTLGVLTFVGLVLLLTDILGLTDVYPFVTRTVNGPKTDVSKSRECTPATTASAQQ